MRELVGTYNLRHVQNDNGRLETDTETGNQTTGNNGAKSVFRRGDHLDNDSDHVDEAANDDGVLSANPVGNITSDQGTEEGTAGQDGGDEGGVAVGELGGEGALDGLVEDGRAVDTVDVTGVIAEEDTTKGGKGTDQIRLPGDGGLDGLDILGSVDAHGLLAALWGADFVRVGHGVERWNSLVCGLLRRWQRIGM